MYFICLTLCPYIYLYLYNISNYIQLCKYVDYGQCLHILSFKYIVKCTYTDDFRLFVGNLGREVTDNMLAVPFMQYPSFIKARVVKNRETSMSRGCYGFVSYGNSVDYLRAIKELHGMYLYSMKVHTI